MAPSAPDASPAQLTVDGTHAVARSLAVGLHRALARRHGWNESPLPPDTGVRVASGDQTRITANVPRPGTSETAP